jgi:hypothetical protein
MAPPGVVGPISADAGHRFGSRNLRHQLGQHRRIAHVVVCHLNGPDLQCLRMAIAAKNARIAWAMLSKGLDYRQAERLEA